MTIGSIDLDKLEAGQTVEVDGVPVFYHDAGEGPAVLFLHGSGPGVSAWTNWRLALPELAKHCRVIAHDQVGFGRSQAGGEVRYGRATWTAQATGLMDALGIERYDLVGNSMGGAIAFSAAVVRPQAVRRIVAMGTMGIPMQLPPGLDRVWGFDPSEGREGMRRLIGLFAYDQGLMEDEQLVEARYAATTTPESAASWKAMFPEPRQRFVDDLSLSYDELLSIEHPVLMTHGYNDRVVPFKDTTLRLMDVLADARMHVFGRCGHWAQLEHTAAFNRLLVSFLAEP